MKTESKRDREGIQVYPGTIQFVPETVRFIVFLEQKGSLENQPLDPDDRKTQAVIIAQTALFRKRLLE